MVVKHTPGPWFASVSTIWKTDADGNEDEVADAWDHGRGEEKTQANARLIAAAPELLEALKAIQEDPTIKAVMKSPLWFVMVEAIAKAEGTQCPA